MHIAVVGPGGIGSTFACQLSLAGHEVTVVARSKRLEQLQRDEAIVGVDGTRAPVKVLPVLDTDTEYDLVLVTVLVSQLDAVLPALTASRAKKVMFMFNTFEPLSRLRDAVGAARFAFGFPSILARLQDGKLASTIVTVGQVSPVTDPVWGKVFSDAGIPTKVEPDMESWLRTHAAVAAPVMTVSALAHVRNAGVTWEDASRSALALQEGLRLVRSVGSTITPSGIGVLGGLPIPVVTFLLWAMSKSSTFKTMGAAGPTEPRALIDAMSAAAPGKTPALLAIRP